MTFCLQSKRYTTKQKRHTINYPNTFIPNSFSLLQIRCIPILFSNSFLQLFSPHYSLPIILSPLFSPNTLHPNSFLPILCIPILFSLNSFLQFFFPPILFSLNSFLQFFFPSILFSNSFLPQFFLFLSLSPSILSHPQ